MFDIFASSGTPSPFCKTGVCSHPSGSCILVGDPPIAHTGRETEGLELQMGGSSLGWKDEGAIKKRGTDSLAEGVVMRQRKMVSN